MLNERMLYNELDNAVMLYALDLLPDELTDEMVDFIDNMDENDYDRFDEINDAVAELLEEAETLTEAAGN